MEWEKPLEKIIRERRSCRAYGDKAIEAPKLEKLKAFLEECNQKNSNFRFVYLEQKDTNGKVGSYGMIAGAQNYVVGIMNKNGDITDFGFEFEKIILFATGLGLGTCWLAGINRKLLDQMVGLAPDELVAVASPVGYAKNIGFKEGLVRRVVSADKRKPWEELFFDGKPGVPLTQAAAGDFALPLEMVRLAPSASNKQPWRLIADQNGFHFCLKRNKGYGDALPIDVQKNDIGIAMCHFELMAESLRLPGKWEYMESMRAVGGLEYIRTWNTGE